MWLKGSLDSLIYKIYFYASWRSLHPEGCDFPGLFARKKLPASPPLLSTHPKGKSQVCMRGIEELSMAFAKRMGKEQRVLERKALLCRLEGFTSVAEIRAISQQLLLAARPWSSVIREVLLGILCELPIPPGSWFCSGTRESWAFRQLHSMPCVQSFAKWPVHQQGLQQTRF